MSNAHFKHPFVHTDRLIYKSASNITDIDIDCVESDRPRIFEYIVGRFGRNKTARVASYGTIVDKGTIEEIGRALRYKWNEDHGLKFDDKTAENPYCLQNIDTIKKDFSASEEKARAKYPDLFYYYDGLINTKISQSVHPAGMVIAPITLDDNYGVFEKDGGMCLMMDMDQAHEVGVAKYDFLVLRNVQIIRDAYAMLGKPYPRTDQIDFNDQNVWKDMLKSPVGIFQFEGEYAFRLLREYKPQSIFDMSLVTACIRPSGASYRDDLIAKKPHHNPSKMIDDLLKDNNGYLVYQEDVIKFLQQICGLSGSEADNVRRAIARKKREILDEAMPKILEGYCSKSDKPRAEAEEEAKEFLQILEDSASYMFGMNHSIGYCLLGYICAHLRYYHPCEFVTSYLNNAANDDDITNGTELAKLYGITISAPKFGLSNDRYTLNLEEKTIAKGVSSIKYMNKAVASELYELAHRIKTDSFVDVLMAMENETSIDSRQLDLLMKIDFFSAYGNSAELAKIRDIFDFFHSSNKQLSKTIKKEKLSPKLYEIVSRHAVGTTKSGGDAKSFTVTDMPAILHECENYIRSMHIPDLDMKVRIQNSLEVLGYVGVQTNREEDRKLATILEIFPLVDKKTREPWAYKTNAQSLGTGRAVSISVTAKEFKNHKLSKGDVVYIIENDRKNELPYKYEHIAWVASKNKKGYWYMYKLK